MGIVHMSRHLVCVHIQIKEAKQRPRAKRLDWPAAARRGEQQAALSALLLKQHDFLKNLNTPQLLVLNGLIYNIWHHWRRI